MCGRFTLSTNMDDLQERFDFEARDLVFRASYNVAPTQQVLAVLGSADDGGKNQPEIMRWGLIPFWAKDPSIGSRMINARSETVAQKPAFRNALQKRRCLVLADGFYEWRKEGKDKVPMYICSRSREPFAMAGLYETWKLPEGEPVRSCTIITTTPNKLMEPIHNRMPVILPRGAEATWLDRENEDQDALTSLLMPYPEGEMEAYVVSTLVNSAKNNFPECIAPAA